MATFETIASTDAPIAAAKANSDGFHELQAAITNLKDGEALRITPDKTVRGLKQIVGKAAKRVNIKVQVWDVENQVYVQLVND